MRYGSAAVLARTNERVAAEAAAGAVAGSAGGGRGTREHAHTRTNTHTYTSARARGAPPRRIAPPTHAQPANRSPRHDHVYHHHRANRRLSRPAVVLFTAHPARSRPPSDETCFPPTRVYLCNIIILLGILSSMYYHHR